MERGLLEGKDLLEVVLERCPVAIGVSVDGLSRYANRAYLRLFGCEAIAERMRRRALGLPVETDYETVGLRKDGTRFDDHVIVAMIVDSDRRLSIAFHEDIIERRRSAKALGESEARFRAVIEQAPIPIGLHRGGLSLWSTLFGLGLALSSCGGRTNGTSAESSHVNDGGVDAAPAQAVSVEPAAGAVDGDTGGCPSSSGSEASSEPEGGAACDAPCGGTCVGGRCLVMLASGKSNANAMAIDSENLYWTEYPASNVKKVTLDGGSVTTLASGQLGVLAIAVDSTSLYWTEESDTGFPNYTQTGTVTKAALDGAMPTTLASGQSNPNSVAVDSTSIYWTNGGTVMCGACGSVVRAALDGASMTTLVSGRNLPTGIAIDSTSVYWIEQAGGTVMKVALDGGSPTTLASVRSGLSGFPVSIAVDGTNVYWTNPGAGTVMKVPLDGGVPTTLASGQCYPGGIVVDSTSVYWTNFGTGKSGTVMKVALDGGSITTLASGQDCPNSMAVDSTSVYWANLCDETIMKLTPK